MSGMHQSEFTILESGKFLGSHDSLTSEDYGKKSLFKESNMNIGGILISGARDSDPINTT